MSATCTDTAAYVLGALDDRDRESYEEHLSGCADCRRDVAELAGLPALLASTSPEGPGEQPPPPETLLPRLLRAVRRERRTRRLLLTGAGAVMVLIAGFGTAAVVHRSDEVDHGVAMSSLVGDRIHATAAISAAKGGSRIVLHCRYDGRSPDSDYALVVTDRDGIQRELATWKLGPDGRADVSASVPDSPAEIATVEVQLSDGRTLLRLRHPA